VTGVQVGAVYMFSSMKEGKEFLSKPNMMEGEKRCSTCNSDLLGRRSGSENNDSAMGCEPEPHKESSLGKDLWFKEKGDGRPINHLEIVLEERAETGSKTIHRKNVLPDASLERGEGEQKEYFELAVRRRGKLQPKDIFSAPPV